MQQISRRGGGLPRLAGLITATALAAHAAADHQGHAGLLPPVDDLADIAPRIAVEVAARAVAEGVAPPRSADELTDRIAHIRWDPRYRTVP